MNATANEIRRALTAFGALGHANAVSRDTVIHWLIRHGFELGDTHESHVRKLKTVASETRTREALEHHPENAVLFCANGLYLPHRTPAAQALDFETCAEFYELTLGDPYARIQLLRSAATSCRQHSDFHTQGSLFA